MPEGTEGKGRKIPAIEILRLARSDTRPAVRGHADRRNLVNVIRARKMHDWIADAGCETRVPLIMAEADSTFVESKQACGRTLVNASNGSSAWSFLVPGE